MKHVKKVWHTALMEKNNPVAELNKHLQMYRATPHPSTGYPPAQLLFGRNINTRLPKPKREENEVIVVALLNDSHAKAVQKKHKDAKAYVKHHQIKMDDHVLLKQQQTKSDPPYDPEPYKVVDIRGHQITATRGDKTLTRDAQKWKAINLREKPNYARENELDIAGACARERTLTQFPDEGDATSACETQRDASSGTDSALTDSQPMDADEQDTSNRRGTQDFADARAPQHRVSTRGTKGQKPARYGIDN